jgi:ribulose-5-phosphate 4-epimerase/fuculose-1-phosphate aldolase
MAVKPESVTNLGDAPEGMSPKEWRMCADLPAAYRLAVIYGWTDLNNTHFSARITDTDHFLLNPFEMFFDEITASSLVWMYRIETACRMQIDAMSGGAVLNPISKATQQHTIEQGLKMYAPGGFIEAGLEWPALIRQLERVDGTGYRA